MGIKNRIRLMAIFMFAVSSLAFAQDEDPIARMDKERVERLNRVNELRAQLTLPPVDASTATNDCDQILIGTVLRNYWWMRQEIVASEKRMKAFDLADPNERAMYEVEKQKIEAYRAELSMWKKEMDNEWVDKLDGKVLEDIYTAEMALLVYYPECLGKARPSWENEYYQSDKDSQQAGPGYPPQGVGSPDP